MTKLWELEATAAAAGIREQRFSAEALTASCLERIAEREPAVGAWAYLDTEYALQQARACDAAQAAGEPLGSLHGLPVGVKDIFDTFDMPTENGTALHAGRTPTRDAFAVAQLREAGAVILGKTVTTEFAVAVGGKTRNPHDLERTPGGSSSGSAAAVADHMVPLAIGTQTSGSVLRPAAFCGVFGYKPSHGLISCSGVLRLSPIDTVGVFARSVADAALLAEPLMIFDPSDRTMQPPLRPQLIAGAGAEPATAPRFAFVRSPVWSEADDETQARIEDLAVRLADHADEVALPSLFDDAVALHRSITWTDIAMNLGAEYDRRGDRMSPLLRSVIEHGRKERAVDYARALAAVPALTAALETALSGYDAMLTPATPGEAPLARDGTGNPVFLAGWTLSGAPTISVPALTGPNGLPLGVQLVGAKGDDVRLLCAAGWLMRTLGM